MKEVTFKKTGSSLNLFFSKKFFSYMSSLSMRKI